MTDREKIESRSRDPITPLRDKLIIFEALLFTQHRIWLYGSGAVVAYVIGLVARFLTHSWIFQADDKPSCIDFSHFWVSGALAGSRDPALVYDFATFSVTRTDLGGIDVCMVMNHFVYPPTYLFFTYPLGLMPYVPAFSVWTVVTLLLYLGAIYLILPRPIAILAALSAYPVFFNFFLGQNGFLLAGLMGVSLALLERRPRLSGILLGLLTFKPQIGILFPFALLVSRKWRVIVSAMATSMVLIVASMLVFGYQGWPSFIHALADRESSLSPISQESMRLESVYGFLWLAGLSPPHRVGHTIGRGRRRCGSRVLGVGEAAPSFPKSCRSLRRGADGNAVRAWARSMRPRDRRRLLGQGRPCARISAWRPLDRAVLLDRDVLGLSRFLERMDPMPGSSCSCCSTYAGLLQDRISSLV
jgi:hypothetical protein